MQAKLETTLHETANAPGECAGKNAEDCGDQQQNRPSTHTRETAMHGQYSGNPWHGGNYKKERMDEAAREGNPRTARPNHESAEVQCIARSKWLK